MQYDISFGGCFYAYTNLTQFGLDITSSPIADIITAAMKLKRAIIDTVTITHPENNELAFLFGVMFYSGPLGSCSEEVCIYADGQVSCYGVPFISKLYLLKNQFFSIN